MQPQFTPRSALRRLRRGAANAVIFVICTVALFCAVIGGIWAYMQLLAEVWNAILHSHTAPGEWSGAAFFSLLGLAVLVFKLNEWLTSSATRAPEARDRS